MKRAPRSILDIPPDVPVCETPEAVPVYPLELLATVASKLLQNDDYGTAVRRAISLLDECSNSLLNRRPGPPKIPIWLPEGPMDFKTLGRYLTDGERPDRAEVKVNDFFKFYIRRMKAEEAAESEFELPSPDAWLQFLEQIPATTPEELNNCLRQLRAKPCSPKSAKRLREEFYQWQSREKSARAAKKGKLGGRPKGDR